MADKKEVLVVMSKVKTYIKNKSGLNVSAAVSQALTDKVASLCDTAIENAKSAGRKTVMEKDF